MKREIAGSSDHSKLEKLWLCLFAIVVSTAVALSPYISLAEGPSVNDPITLQGRTPDLVAPFYATNRGRNVNASGEVRYNGDRGEPHYGRCLVEFSPIPLASELASVAPFHLPRETSRISILEESDRQVFWSDLVAAAAQTSSRSVILFVHGYNYRFKRTCRMAAELQRTLRAKATVVMVSCHRTPCRPIICLIKSI